MFRELIEAIRDAFVSPDRQAMQRALRYMVANGCIMHRNLSGRG